MTREKRRNIPALQLIKKYFDKLADGGSAPAGYHDSN